MLPSPRRNHSRWVMPVSMPSTSSALRAHLVYRRVLRPAMLSRQQDVPLDPRRAHDLERRRRVLAHRVEQVLAVERHGVEGELLARAGIPRAEPVLAVEGESSAGSPKLVLVVDPEGVLAAGAGRRLDDERVAAVAAERSGFFDRGGRVDAWHTERRRAAADPSCAPCRGSSERPLASCPEGPAAPAPRPRPPASARECR